MPTDWSHVEKYPLRATLVTTVPIKVEKTLKLPSWHWTHDQGAEGACVGFGSSMMMSILNKRRYVPHWLWNEAKAIDEWPETNPGDNEGTSVRAACDILRTKGHLRKYKKWFILGPQVNDGILANRWATTVDEMRAAINTGTPISIGVNWYSNFDTPQQVGKEYWVGQKDLGAIRGGHCVCIYGASDRRQAFRLKNSWGRNYPLTWLPYNTMQRLLNEYGEATLVTDR